MTDNLHSDEQVEWNTPQGKTSGKVKRKLTSEDQIKGHHVEASPQHPEYLVQSDKSGKEAAHKPSELQKGKSRKKPQA